MSALPTCDALPEVELTPGYRVPRLIRGTWQLHEAGRAGDRSAILAGLMATFDRGFWAIEAADTYDGVEDLLGAFRTELRSRRGTEAAARLKVHTRISQSGAAGLDRAAVRARVEAARRRLGQERLDLVQLQWWNLAVPGWLEAGRELADCRRAGLVGEVAATNFPPRELAALLDAGVPVIANQVQMSLLDPRAARALGPLCRARGVRLMAYAPLAGGFLTDAWRGRPPPGPTPSPGERFGPVYRRLVDRFGGWAWLQDLLAVLAERGTRLGVREGARASTVALAWVLNRMPADAALIGIGTPARADDHARAARLALGPDDVAAIEAVLASRGETPGEVADLERTALAGTIAASYALAS